jgi:tRNA 2-thiouridine synthesizing protein A
MDANEDLTADRILDATALKCPLPALKARKALLAMAEGQRLRLIATDPMAPIDIPHFCAEAGHTLIAATQQDDGYVFLIERGGSPRGR